jgi:hypothetical protein
MYTLFLYFEKDVNDKLDPFYLAEKIFFSGA